MFNRIIPHKPITVKNLFAFKRSPFNFFMMGVTLVLLASFFMVLATILSMDITLMA